MYGEQGLGMDTVVKAGTRGAWTDGWMKEEMNE